MLNYFAQRYELTTIIDGSCHKYHFCRDKHVFSATKLRLPRQNIYCDKIMFLATNTCLFCRDKIMFVMTKVLSGQTCLSRQACFCRDKRLFFFCRDKKIYLWQLLPMIHDVTVLCLYEIIIIIGGSSSSSSSSSRSCYICFCFFGHVL